MGLVWIAGTTGKYVSSVQTIEREDGSWENTIHGGRADDRLTGLIQE